ncbi:MAG TPA: TonB-dependent receptor, partial [Novosphingobium sp.]|nr:TonB-dependent receptor [Novosphingobium sp.]
QERLDNFEVGIKSRFWHNRASIRASAYYDQYRNGQISNSIPYYVTGSPTVNLLSVVQNIGAVDLKGVEIDGDLAPLPGLVLNGSFGLADSEIKSYVCLECQQEMGTTNATGHRLAGAPKWVWTLGAAYEHEIANDITGNIRIDYRHRGSQYVDNANLAKSQPDDQIDLRAGVKRHGLSVEAFVTNLFNERTYIGGQALDLIALSTSGAYKNEIRLALPELRRVGIRASIDF